jgi:hypothetical protein
MKEYKMSYIDTIEHSYVGDFLGLPLYHPLEKTDGASDEFEADIYNLVIGGGSGEHPGLVIKNLDACVYSFLEFIAEFNDKDTDEIDFYENWFSLLSDEESYSYNPYINLEFASWGMDETANFTSQVKEKFSKAIAYCKKAESLNKNSSEKKIQIMLGEFIYFCAPHLLSSKTTDYLVSHKDKLLKEVEYIEGVFYPVAVTPKGYGAGGGKYFEYTSKGQMKGSWGLRFDEEKLATIVNNARFGNVPAIKYLLKIGSDKHVANDMALLKAIENNQQETIDYLMSIGLKINNVNEKTVEQIVRNGHVDMLKLLEQQNLNFLNVGMLNIAISAKQEDMVQYLLEKKFTLDKDSLQLLITIDSPEMADVLINYGADKDYIREHAGSKIGIYLKNKEATELSQELEEKLPAKAVTTRKKM